MTKEQAIARAASLAKKQQETYFVLYDEGWQVATEYDLDTFYFGIDPELEILPNGEIY